MVTSKQGSDKQPEQIAKLGPTARGKSTCSICACKGMNVCMGHGGYTGGESPASETNREQLNTSSTKSKASEEESNFKKLPQLTFVGHGKSREELEKLAAKGELYKVAEEHTLEQIERVFNSYKDQLKLTGKSAEELAQYKIAKTENTLTITLPTEIAKNIFLERLHKLGLIEPNPINQKQYRSLGSTPKPGDLPECRPNSKS